MLKSSVVRSKLLWVLNYPCQMALCLKHQRSLAALSGPPLHVCSCMPCRPGQLYDPHILILDVLFLQCKRMQSTCCPCVWPAKLELQVFTCISETANSRLSRIHSPGVRLLQASPSLDSRGDSWASSSRGVWRAAVLSEQGEITYFACICMHARMHTHTHAHAHAHTPTLLVFTLQAFATAYSTPQHSYGAIGRVFEHHLLVSRVGPHMCGHVVGQGQGTQII